MPLPAEVEIGSAQAADSKAQRWNLIAGGIALVTGIGAVLLPLGQSSSVDSSGLETNDRVSLLSSEGASVLIISLSTPATGPGQPGPAVPRGRTAQPPR
jgi:hypothetical protein